MIIHPGVVIGTEGISFERDEKQELEWFPQLGGVIIEDDVEIGANSVITRGPLPRSNTVIGEGTKVDTLVEVGHGVRIGRHCIIIGQTIICGRVTIDDYSYVSGQVFIKQGVKIGSNVFIGAGSTVLEDVSDNLVMIGTPARPLRGNITE